MKKIYLLYLSLGLMVSGLVIILLGFNILGDNPKVIVSENDTNGKVYSSSISMMLETSAGSGEYMETMDTTWAQAIDRGYTFNEIMSKCENGSILTWNETNKTVMFSGNVSDKCYVYFDVIILEKLSEHIINLYSIDGVDGLYYHDGIGTYGEYEAGDNSYRYSGADPNNYVCFGSTAATCPTDNLYRIIGVFDGKIKLIKKTMLSSTMAWDSGNKNIWSTASLNTYLNGTFLTSLGDNANRIANHSWIVGGNTYDSIIEQINAKTVYQAEMTNPATADKVTAKIGLMYVSEYRYAADPTKASVWSAVHARVYNNSTVTANNWMYMGLHEWTISRCSGFKDVAFIVYESGCVYADSFNLVMDSGGVRPSFYLESSVELSGGNGSASTPYRLA